MTESFQTQAEIAEWCLSSPWLAWDSRKVDSTRGYLSIPIRHPKLSQPRDILGQPQLVVPSGDDHVRPYVKLAHTAILKVPHLDEEGKLCLFADEEELDYFSRTEQLSKVVDRFIDVFIPNWESGNLDEHFYDEPENYWRIYTNRHPTKKSEKPQNLTAYLLSRRENKFVQYDSYRLEDLGVVCSRESNFKTRFLESIKSTRHKCNILEVPIFCSFQPSHYPSTLEKLKAICRAAIGIKETQKFFNGKNFSVARLIVLRAPNCDYGYYLPAEGKLKVMRPIICEKTDPDWLFGRYEDLNIVNYTNSKIALIGAGSLGSHILHILTHSGVGEIHLIDSDIFKPANIGRHTLGIKSLGKSKASQLSSVKGADTPNCKLVPEHCSAQKWLKQTDISKFNLIIDATGERTVRELIATKRSTQHVTLVTAWMEPFITAAHVVIFYDQTKWNINGLNLWNEAHAFEGWPKDYLLSEPGCSSRFAPYTLDQLSLAAGITAEECLSALSNKPTDQVKIKSWVRGHAYTSIQKYIAERRNWATLPNNIDGAIITRQF